MLATQDVYPSSTAHLTNDERRERLREKAYFIDMQMLSFAQEAAEFAAPMAGMRTVRPPRSTGSDSTAT